MSRMGAQNSQLDSTRHLRSITTIDDYCARTGWSPIGY